MRRHLATLAGLAVLAAAWTGPLPDLVPRSFAAHMTLHMAVVALAAPLLAFGLCRDLGRNLAGRRWAAFLFASPLVASLVDLVVIWGWHAPLAHEAARRGGLGLVAEQASFLAAGLLLWLSVLSPLGGPQARLAGAAALLFTSMHMTLLGVLISLAETPICRAPSGEAPLFGLSVMEDQQSGGLLMLAVGGAVYLLAGLGLVAGLLTRPGEAAGGRA